MLLVLAKTDNYVTANVSLSLPAYYDSRDMQWHITGMSAQVVFDMKDTRGSLAIASIPPVSSGGK